MFGMCFRPLKLGRFMLFQDNKVATDLTSFFHETSVQWPQDPCMQIWIVNGVKEGGS